MRDVISGEWRNQHGSTMNLELDDAGRLQGTFVSGVGFGHHTRAFPVTGFAAKGLVVFAVDFSEFESMTTWCGHLVDADGGPRLHTLWQMAVRLDRAGEVDEWKGTWTGSDVFVRTTSKHVLPPPAGRPSHPTRKK